MSAKKVEIDWKMVGRYLNAQCSGVAIASILGIHENTLYERCKTDQDMEFMAFAALKKAEGIELIRSKQFELAMRGDRTMLVWLGKQLLGQKEQVEQTIHIPQVVLQPANQDDMNAINEGLSFLEESQDQN